MRSRKQLNGRDKRLPAACKKKTLDKVNCKLRQSGLPRGEGLTYVQPVADKNEKDRKVSA
jgi:hypothetical protein